MNKLKYYLLGLWYEVLFDKKQTKVVLFPSYFLFSHNFGLQSSNAAYNILALIFEVLL